MTRSVALLWILGVGAGVPFAPSQTTRAERQAVVGDAPADPGPLAADMSGALEPAAIQNVMRKVADWQVARIADSPSQDWTFATLYVGLLSASDTLKAPQYRGAVSAVGEHYHWTLGPRKTHADDQAIGQAYLWLDRDGLHPEMIQPMQTQLDKAMQVPDDPGKPIWWWCDALFMAPPVWSGLAAAKHDPRYLTYMDREWHAADDLLWDKQERLFFRDATYFDKREKNGRKIFWSRGNGWVMGGLVRVLEALPANDPRRSFYEGRLVAMAERVAKLQGADGLWRAGLLDPDDYPNPEVSGSAFFVYAMTWGMNHHLLDARRFAPVVQRGWAGLVRHIYADGRLGCIQPVGAAPGAYSAGASYVFGVGAFLLAGSEVNVWAGHSSSKPVAALRLRSVLSKSTPGRVQSIQ